MKKIISLVLIFTVVFCLAACKKDPADSTANNAEGGAQTQSPSVDSQEIPDTTESTVEEITADNWGVAQRGSAWSNTYSEGYYVNFPNYTGYTESHGYVAEQLDGTMVITCGQNDESPEIGSVSELFPAYFDQLKFTMRATHGLHTQNHVFTLKRDSAEVFGDYQMHRFDGEVEFDDWDEHVKYAFVAYATTLKSNGAYAYWVVYDLTDDQSNGDLIAEHALNMAKTFREEE